MFGRIIPLTLALAGSGLQTVPSARSRLEGDLVHRLLREALLRPADLPAGFLPVGAPDHERRASLFDGGPYEGQSTRLAHARFVERDTGQIIEQQIGLLARDAGGSLDGASLTGYMAGRERAATTEQGVAATLAARYARCARFEAIMLRRHQLVMAIASWQIGAARDASLRPRDLAPAADARWRDIADVLVKPEDRRSR